MKKLISCILLLTLCLGLLAGCTEETPATDGLASAKEYLEAMYKETNNTETTANYTRVGVVTIQGVGTFNVTWTSSSDAITVTPDGKMVNIVLPEVNETELSYTLTATISDGNGKTEALVFNYTMPATGKPGELKDGTYVITNGTLSMTAVAADKSYGYPTGNAVTISGSSITGHTAEDIFTVTNVEGGFTLQDHLGRYYYMKGTYTSPNLSDTIPEEGHVWKLVVDGENTNIVNVLNGGTLAYSTSYSSWGVYTTLTEDHNPNVTIVAASAPSEGGSTTDPTDPTEPAGDEPAADSTLTVAEAIALGASKDHNTYTAGKYYVTGEITEIYNTQYGNMKIKDAEGNILTIYGTYSADGETRFDAMTTQPQVGDTVTIYGIIGQYNDTPQIKNGWITNIA